MLRLRENQNTVYNNHIDENPINRFDFIDDEVPLDVVYVIFLLAITALTEIAMVSKKWQEIVYNKDFYKELYKTIDPSRLINGGVWEKYIGKPEKETLLPFCIFKTMENDKGSLIWVTETVEITDKDGTARKVLINPKTMEEIGRTPKVGNPTVYHMVSSRAPIEEARTPERSHWVWMEEKAIGRNVDYQEQQRLAQARGGNVSGLNDTIVKVFMEQISSGKGSLNRGLVWGSRYDKVRVNEMTTGRRIVLHLISYYYNTNDTIEKDPFIFISRKDDDAHNDIVVFVTKKSFGRCDWGQA